MNDNFETNTDNIQPEMTPEERKAHKKTISKLCLSYLGYLVIVEILVVAISYILGGYAPNLLTNPNYSMIISSVLQYLVAFPILILMLKGIPAKAPSKRALNARSFLKYAVVSMFIMYVGNYISSMLMTYIEAFLGRTPENSVDTMLNSTNIVISILIVGIIGPIVEELMFRKLFIDRLSPYGEAIAIFFPSLMFGLFHGNLYQFFYAFFLGIAFSYIYVKTGKIIYSTVLHMFINLFCGVLPAYILSLFNYEEFINLTLEGAITEEYIMANAMPLTLLGIYEFAMLAMVGIGIFTLTRNLRYIRFEKGECKFPKGTVADTLFFNAGAVGLIAICIVLMAINTFAV